MTRGPAGPRVARHAGRAAQPARARPPRRAAGGSCSRSSAGRRSATRSRRSSPSSPAARRFAASCPEPVPVLTLAVQPLVVAGLFAVAPAAAVAAFASIVALAVAAARGGDPVGRQRAGLAGRRAVCSGSRSPARTSSGSRGAPTRCGARRATGRRDPEAPARDVDWPHAPPQQLGHLGGRPGVPARAARHGLATGRVATAAELGRHVGVSTQAASEMCRRLAADGLLEPATGRGLVLTTAGRAAADAIFRRHALLEWLLTVGRRACRGRRATSRRCASRARSRRGSRRSSTSSSATRRRARTATRSTSRPPAAARPARRCPQLESGTKATVLRITEEAEEDAGLLSYLEARALTPGRARHGPRPLGDARLADARGPARARDARPAARPPSSASSRATPTRRCSTSVPSRAAPTRSHGRRHPRPDRAQPHRSAPHRDRAHRAVQLPVRPPHRRHVRAPARGHGRRPEHRRRSSRTSSTACTGWGSPGTRGPASPGCEEAGPYAPYRQMARLPDYAAAAATLLAADAAYPCYCTPEELEADRLEPGGEQAAAALRRPVRRADARRARRARGRGPAGRPPVPRPPRRRRLGRPRPRPGRDRHVQPRRRLRHRPGGRHAAVPLHGGRRRHGDADQPRDPGRGPRLATRPSTSCCSRRSATRCRCSPTCRSSSTRTARR